MAAEQRFARVIAQIQDGMRVAAHNQAFTPAARAAERYTPPPLPSAAPLSSASPGRPIAAAPEVLPSLPELIRFWQAAKGNRTQGNDKRW